MEVRNAASLFVKRHWRVLVAAVVFLVVLRPVLRFVLGPVASADRVRRQNLIATLVVNGRVLAKSKAELGAPVTGTVVSVLVREGDRVVKGQRLIELDTSDLRAQLAQARMRLTQAQGKLADLRQSTARGDTERVAKARSNLTKAERDLKRAADLHAAGISSQADLDAARNNADIARAELRTAQADVSSSTRGGEESATVAAVEESRAAVDGAAARLAQASVLAPAAGTILTRTVEPGDVVSPGRILLTIAYDSETLLLAQPDEKNLPFLKVGDRARASADAYPDRSFDAVVEYVSPGVDLSRGTVDVKLRVPDPPPYLRNDMTLSVEIETGRRQGALVIPLGSVHDVNDQPWVLVSRRGRAVRQAITLGLHAGDWAEVSSGLKEGELVVRVTEPVQAGDRIRAREES